MNEIFERTSVRYYTDEPVSNDDVQKLMKAAMAAPSAVNLQPWQFIVLQNPENLKKASRISPYSKVLEGAGLGVIVLGDLDRSKEGYILQDCSAAVENMLLEAVTLGLGGVWLGVYPEQDRMDAITKMFDLPANLLPVCMVSIGHPRTKQLPRLKFDPAKIHYEKY